MRPPVAMPLAATTTAGWSRSLSALGLLDRAAALEAVGGERVVAEASALRDLLVELGAALAVDLGGA